MNDTKHIGMDVHTATISAAVRDSSGKLHAVYHRETGIRTLKELACSYLTITRDLIRVMNLA